MINNCSISGKDVGSFNTANSLQNSKCSVDQTKAKTEVESQVGHVLDTRISKL